MNDIDITHICPNCMKDMGESSHVCPYCGYSNNQTEESNTHALKPYTILQGKYLVGNVLGEGGFGITYIGLDLNLEIRVAIKEFYPNGFVTRESGVTSMVTNYTSSDRPQYEKWKDSFVREARSLAKFSDLPGIVHVKDFFQENNTAYIVMEYVEGETLKSHLKNCGGKMPVQETLSMMRPVIQSLAKIHQAQIIHRDISPDNIMIQEGGSVKLIDFGAARDFGNGDDRSLSVLLKPGFAPEEQYRSKGNQGPWTDVYALCATIYRCITGEKPPESMERMRQDTMKYPSSYGIIITKSEESALLNGLAIFAENRIKTMGELEAKLYDNTGWNAGYQASFVGQPLRNNAMQQTAQITYVNDSLQNNTDNTLYSGNSNKKGVQDKKNIYIAFICALTAVVLILIFVITIGISKNNKHYDEAKVTVDESSKKKEASSEQTDTVKEDEPQNDEQIIENSALNSGADETEGAGADKDSSAENANDIASNNTGGPASESKTNAAQNQQENQNESAIHRYEIITADFTWNQAFQDCIRRGGYLVRINSLAEFHVIVAQIKRENRNELIYYVAGVRDVNNPARAYEYHWKYADGTLGDDVLNDFTGNSIYGSMWLETQPSFGDVDGDGNYYIEEYVDLLRKSGEYYLNDIPDDVLSIVPSYSGRIGYICEYEY